MAWTSVECATCGEEYQVQMYGPTKTREWKAAHWNGICDDCKEAAKAALVEENKSGALPELTGSDKQIAWAMKIRADFITYTEDHLDEMAIEDIIEDCEDDHNIKADKRLIHAAIDQLLNHTSAHWWIDTARNKLNNDLILSSIVDIHSTVPNDTEADLEKDLQADVEAEAVMMPQRPLTDTIADIRQTDDKITISFKEKRDSFKEIVKDFGYRWDYPWTKKLSFKNESADDCVAEIGNALLGAGFCIRVMNPDIREKIITADFKPEHTRWISVLQNKPDHFYISWTYSDDMYSEAKRITGARYDRPGVVVPMEHLDEVQDFADTYQFRFSPAALDLIARANANKAAALVVDVARKETPELPQASNGIPDLGTPEHVAIHDELRD